MVPCVGYAVVKTKMDASALRTRESFMFELGGAISTLSMDYIGIFKRALYLFVGPLTQESDKRDNTGPLL
jgi:hypothetical protein